VHLVTCSIRFAFVLRVGRLELKTIPFDTIYRAGAIRIDVRPLFDPLDSSFPAAAAAVVYERPPVQHPTATAAE
jgi:hypothetical protein